MKAPAKLTLVGENRPKIKKTDWFYYYLFYPVFKLPHSFTPNHVSYLRMIICIPFLMLILYHHFVAAGLIMISCALMDGLDGAMTRIRNQISDFGKLLDPLADKTLNITCYLAFLPYVKSETYGWFAWTMVLIDTILAFVAFNKYLIHFYLPNMQKNHWLRSWLNPEVILANVKVDETGANNYGKTKMVLQVITLSAMLLFDPNADFFVATWIRLPFGLDMYDLLIPLFIASIGFGSMSLWGHLKVVHFNSE